MKRATTLVILAMVTLSSLAASGASSNKAVPDRLIVEEPTFCCLGVEWFIKGDDNRNAIVEFHYRKAGDKTWREAMPLWQVDSTGWIRKVPAGQELFAGSIFNLEQGTSYEMKLNLRDPDGGDVEKTVTATTRTEPVLPKNGRVRYVAPGNGGGSGTKADPFKGLKSADAAAQPGDVMQLASGAYKGAWTLAKSGSASKPIVWLGPSDNSAIIDGDGGKIAVNADGLQHVWFWHLSVTNAESAITAQKSSYMVVRYCHISKTENGFTATHNPMKGNVILDSIFEGWVPWTLDGKRLTYPDIVFDYNGKRYDYTNIVGVNASGEGTVVAFNRMTAWGDGIHGSGDQPKCAQDFYNNEISESADDGIECDEGAQNIRCFENRMTNCFQGISFQPVHGGPVYVFRNALYNTSHCPFKLENNPHGALIINNTSLRAAGVEAGAMPVFGSAPVYHIWVGNNLFAGGDNSSAIHFSPRPNGVSFDYNGYAGGPWKVFAEWAGQTFPTLQDFQKAVKQEEHAVTMPLKGLFASGRTYPESVDKIAPLSENDLRLASGTAAVDAGWAFPGITDGFAGKAPDLGAYELGSELPHYGPRAEK
jgi:hypothetical protein